MFLKTDIYIYLQLHLTYSCIEHTSMNLWLFDFAQILEFEI